jgi:hypothetical protein
MTPLAPLVTTFFRNHLAVEKGVSKNTIASYSYAFKFLCRYVSDRLGKSPSALALEDLDAQMIREYLEHIERDRSNTSRTRNLRLTAIRSFMKYVEYEVPSALEQTRQILAISNKRTEERLINHLTREEMNAVLDRHRTRRPVPQYLGPRKRPKPTSSSALEGGSAGTSGLVGCPWDRSYSRALLECTRRGTDDLRVQLYREEARPRGRPALSESVEEGHCSACPAPHLCNDQPASNG